MDQNQPQQESELEKSLREVMRTLPPVIREYIAQGKYTTVAKTLAAKYGLRIDQAGALEKGIMLLLIGVETPEEFMQSLAEEAQISQQVVGSLVKDINEQVFVSLRAEEMKSKDTAVGVGQAAPRNAPPPQSPGSEGGGQPKKYFHLENKIPLPRPEPAVAAPHIAPLPPKAVMPRSNSPLGAAVRAALAPSQPIRNDRLLEDHEEPHITLDAAPKAPESRGKPPLSQVLPKAVPPPANLPGALPPIVEAPAPSVVRPAPVFQKVAPIAPRPVQTPATPIAPATTPQKYTADPYREPIDESPGTA